MDIDCEAICAGCGASSNLSHSHIISRGDKGLMDDPNNIAYHCLPVYGSKGCSDTWEQVGLRAGLIDYRRNMEYIRSVRPLIFNKMIVADYQYMENHPKFTCALDNFDYICKSFNEL